MTYRIVSAEAGWSLTSESFNVAIVDGLTTTFAIQYPVQTGDSYFTLTISGQSAADGKQYLENDVSFSDLVTVTSTTAMSITRHWSDDAVRSDSRLFFNQKYYKLVVVDHNSNTVLECEWDGDTREGVNQSGYGNIVAFFDPSNASVVGNTYPDNTKVTSVGNLTGVVSAASALVPYQIENSYNGNTWNPPVLKTIIDKDTYQGIRIPNGNLMYFGLSHEQIANDFTIYLKVKAETTSQVLFSAADNSGTTEEIIIRYNGGYITARVKNNANSEVTVGALNTNFDENFTFKPKTHIICVTRSTADNYVRIYVNGTLGDSQILTGNLNSLWGLYCYVNGAITEGFDANTYPINMDANAATYGKIAIFNVAHSAGQVSSYTDKYLPSTLTDTVEIEIVDPPYCSYRIFTGYIGVGFSSTPTVVNSSGNSYEFVVSVDSVGDIPPGLSLNASTGEISGTPSQLGTFPNILIECLDSAVGAYSSTKIAIRIVALEGRRVVPKNPKDPTPTEPGFFLLYNDRLGTYQEPLTPLTPTVRELVAPYAYSVISGELPEDLVLNETTGAITGIPRVTGSHRLTVENFDSNGDSASSTFTIYIGNDVVEPPEPPIVDKDPDDGDPIAGNFVPGSWGTYPKLDIRPLTRVYMEYNEPIIAFGKPHDVEVVAASDASIYEYDSENSWQNPGESMPTPTSRPTIVPYFEWSANSLLDEVSHSTTDPAVIGYTPTDVTTWPTVSGVGPSWTSVVDKRPKKTYNVYLTPTNQQRVERFVLFNDSSEVQDLTVDLGTAYTSITVFLVAHINPNSTQETHVLFDTNYTGHTGDVPNRAALILYRDRLLASTQLRADPMPSDKKIIVPQEYSVSWRSDKPVVFYARFCGNLSKAGYYLPGKEYSRKGGLSTSTHNFRYLTLARPYNASIEELNAEMSLYGVVIVPDFVSNVDITAMCQALSSKYGLEEMWTP